MDQSTSTTADETGLYPGGGNLDIPKRGGLWKYAAGGAAGILFVGGLATGYKALKSDYKTPDNSQKHAIVETEGVPEGFGKTPEIAEGSVNIEDKKLYQDPLKSYSRISEKELNSFMDRFELPHIDRGTYGKALNDLTKIIGNKSGYVRHEIKNVFDGPDSKNLPEDKIIIVYSWHRSKSGKESALRWHFSPNSPSEDKKWGIFYKYGGAPR